MITEQKFFYGDYVHINRKGEQFKAIILGSYFDLYGDQVEDSCKDYHVMLMLTGSTYSWIHEHEIEIFDTRRTAEFIHELKLRFHKKANEILTRK